MSAAKNNSNARKGNENRVTMTFRVDKVTQQIIKNLAKLWAKSQGEVIDQLAKEQTPDD